MLLLELPLLQILSIVSHFHLFELLLGHFIDDFRVYCTLNSLCGVNSFFVLLLFSLAWRDDCTLPNGWGGLAIRESLGREMLEEGIFVLEVGFPSLRAREGGSHCRFKQARLVTMANHSQVSLLWWAHRGVRVKEGRDPVEVTRLFTIVPASALIRCNPTRWKLVIVKTMVFLVIKAKGNVSRRRMEKRLIDWLLRRFVNPNRWFRMNIALDFLFS